MLPSRRPFQSEMLTTMVTLKRHLKYRFFNFPVTQPSCPKLSTLPAPPCRNVFPEVLDASEVLDHRAAGHHQGSGHPQGAGRPQGEEHAQD